MTKIVARCRRDGKNGDVYSVQKSIQGRISVFDMGKISVCGVILVTQLVKEFRSFTGQIIGDV